MFLYGTPSESGNIGLRVGDTVTYYNGAVLPKLPEWDTTVYPYAVMDNRGGSVGVRLFVCSAPIGIYYHNKLGHILSAGSSADNIRFDFIEFRNIDNAWTTYRTLQGVMYLAKDMDVAYKPVWANTTFLYRTDKDTGAVTLVLASSDPIPVGKIVDYNGEIPIYEVKT